MRSMRSIFQFQDPVRMVEGRHGNMVYNQYCHWIGKALQNKKDTHFNCLNP